MIIDDALKSYFQTDSNGKFLLKDNNGLDAQPSNYKPTNEEKDVLMMIIDSFRWADVSKRKPRREFNDLSEISRMMIDQMAFNIYQPNNGQAYEGDQVNAWKSHAMRPIIRNKAISIAAHITAKLLFPKVFARNQASENQEDAAIAMRDLIEYASDENDYARNTFHAVINALVNPMSVTHIEYADAYRTIKTEKVNGKWQTKEVLDKDNSGFKLTQVPVDEFFYEDFYQSDVQKQGYIIWRRVQNYATMKAKYGHKKNFKFVKAGYQILYNDANVSFYEVYDSNLRGHLCEEIIFYSKPLDLQIACVNGIMMDEPDEPNPRIDKNYPFITFYFEPFDEGRSICGKSLAFKTQPDADIINTLYPTIIDGTYLSVMAPMIVAGEEVVGSDVIIPGMVTTLSNPGATITPLRVAQDIRTGMEMLSQVEQSITESSNESPMGGAKTAYAMSIMNQQSQTMLIPFITMVKSYVRQYGKLVIGDILQYLTIPEVDKIIDNGELVYKTFIVHDRQTDGGVKSRKIKFDGGLPSEVDDKEELGISFDIMNEQGGEKTQEEIYKANPRLFIDLDYITTVSADVFNPMSDELEKAMGLELFDRSIQLPALGVNVDMEQICKDFLFGLYPKSANNVDKYFKQEPVQQPQQGQQMPEQQPGQSQQGVNPGANPLAGQGAKSGGSPLTQTGRVSPMAAMKNSPISSLI